MGIPKLFRWLVDLYPSVQQRISESLGPQAEQVDNFYLDMNGIIHDCTHANADEIIELDERKMFQKIFQYTDRLYKIVAPRRVGGCLPDNRPFIPMGLSNTLGYIFVRLCTLLSMAWPHVPR